MTKTFKSYIVNTFILVTFSLLQITNVNANYLKEYPQKEDASFSAMKQEQKEAINTAAFYASNFIYGANSEDGTEGKKL